MENKKHNLTEAYLNSLTEDQRLSEMEQWTPEEVAAYLCSQGTITIQEFDNLLTKRITELWNGKYGGSNHTIGESIDR